MAKHDMGVKIRFSKGAWWLFINHRSQRRAKKIGDRQTALRAAQQVREAIVAGDLALTPSLRPKRCRHTLRDGCVLSNGI
jgi:hypothetical protein